MDYGTIKMGRREHKLKHYFRHSNKNIVPLGRQKTFVTVSIPEYFDFGLSFKSTFKPCNVSVTYTRCVRVFFKIGRPDKY